MEIAVLTHQFEHPEETLRCDPSFCEILPPKDYAQLLPLVLSYENLCKILAGSK